MHEVARQMAVVNQQIAQTRQGWVDGLRADFRNYIELDWRDEADISCEEFIMWAEDRAHFARCAMALMGVTEDDQFYA